jgi:DNA-binding FadR family transcriptional regulator
MSRTTPSPFAAVRSVRAHERIVEQLQQLILGGQLPVGSRLPSEREMIVEFDVSRPTVREALRVAESMGLISVRPGDPSGPKVLGAPGLGISRVLESLLKAGCASAKELIELRILIESAAAVQAATQPKRRLADLEARLKQMKAVEDSKLFADLDVHFHRALLEAGGNRLFLLIFQSLQEPIQALIEHSLDGGSAQSREQALAHHAEILAALKAGDAASAQEAVHRHLGDFYQALLKLASKDKVGGKSAAR